VHDAAAPADRELLAAIGVDPADGELRVACARIARRLRGERARVIGFVPSDDSVAVPPLLVHLGLALCELTGSTVAVVDANVRYPALAHVTGGTRRHDDSVFATRWLGGSLALLSPPRVERAGEVVPQLARALIAGAELFAHVLVDLTGFELLGEHASAATCMDAVALVARAHRTRERELVELARLMPGDRRGAPKGQFLGVLLVG